MPLSLEIHRLFPFFTHSYTNLGSSLLLWWKLFITQTHPGIPDLGAVANALESSFTLFPVSCQGSGLKSPGQAACHVPHWSSGSSTASTSPNKICQADKKLISLLHSLSRHSSSPGCGRNAELGLELVSAQVRNELECEMCSGSASSVRGHLSYLHPGSALAALRVEPAPVCSWSRCP